MSRYDDMLKVRRVVEYWVSEIDDADDVIDYTAQTGNRAAAQREFDGPATFAATVAKRLERVVAHGSEADGVREQEMTEVDFRLSVS